MTIIHQIPPETTPVHKPWIVLGFKFKKDWEAELRKIKRTPHGQEITEGHTYLMAALACHPDVAEKTGAGVHHFETGPGPDGFGSTCFYVVRVDGSKASFSYKTCLNGKASPWAIFCSALRGAVSLEILDWKNRQFDSFGFATCGLCGASLNRNEVHADHVHPNTFNALAIAFCRDNYINPEMVKYADSPMWELADKQLEQEWIEYHRSHCTLRILCAPCNTKLGDRAA